MAYDFVDLSQVIARRNGHSDVKISRPKPESMPPIDLNVFTMRDDIALAFVQTEVDLRRATASPARDNRHVRDGFNVQQAASFIVPRLDTLAGVPSMPSWGDVSGVAVLLGLRDMHRVARRVCGTAELVTSLPGYCEKCRVPALSRRDGSDTVHCAACRHDQPWEAYRRRVTLVVHSIPHDTREGDT